MEPSEKRSGIIQWCCLVVGLAVAHFLMLCFVEAAFISRVYSGPRLPGPNQPPLLYHVFMYVFAFPGLEIVRAAHLGPQDGAIGLSLLAVTCLLWGCAWAEPFRRKYGWQPWRFNVRDLLAVTTVAAVILAVIALLSK